MSDKNDKTETTLTLDDVKKAVADALKGVGEAIGELTKNQKILADTFAADKAAAEAAKKDAPAEKKEGDAPKGLTADEIVKLLDERDAARQAAQQTKAAKQAARQAVIDAKLKDVPAEFLASLPDTDDAGQLAAAADKIVARVNEVLKVKLPDVGGVQKDGGKPAGSGGDSPRQVGSGLSEGAAKFAAAIKLPA